MTSSLCLFGSYYERWYFHHFRWNFPSHMDKFHSYMSFPHRGHSSPSWCLLNWREFPHIYRTRTWFVCFIYPWELAVAYNFSMNNNLVLICEMSPVLEPCINDDIFLTSKGKDCFFQIQIMVLWHSLYFIYQILVTTQHSSTEDLKQYVYIQNFASGVYLFLSSYW